MTFGWWRCDQACGAVQALGRLAGIVQQVLPRPLLAETDGPPRKAGGRTGAPAVGHPRRSHGGLAFWEVKRGFPKAEADQTKEPPRFGGLYMGSKEPPTSIHRDDIPVRLRATQNEEEEQ